jgi:glycosyltransferase involved in cell wall biosynthesis
MYICIVSRGFPSNSDPFNGIFELDQAEALMNEGHKVVFLILDFRSILKKRRLGFYVKYQNDKIPSVVVSFPFGNIEKSFFVFFSKKIATIGARILIKKFGIPDVLHSHFLNISNLALEIKKLYHIPLIATEHSSSLNSDVISRSVSRLGINTYKNVDILISVSNSMRNRLLFHFGVDSYVVPNIVSLNNFKSVVLGPRIKSNNSFIFVSVGALNHNKGFDVLLKAFKDSGFPNDVFLNIIGEGELFEDLNELIIALKLQGQVKLLGYKSRAEIYDYLSNSDSFVLASRGETFGVAYIEALLIGLPIIATNCGGPKDIVNSNNGLLVSVDNIYELTNALKFLYKHAKNYNSSLISQDTIKHYSPTVVANMLHTYYKMATK